MLKFIFTILTCLVSVQAQIPITSGANACQLSRLLRANGTQVQTGVCSTTPQGEIPTVDRMTSVLITEPKDGAVLRSKTQFTVNFKYRNLNTGNFADPAINYNLFAQTLDANGFIRGHSHITIQKIDVNLVNVPDPKVPDFFLGLNGAANAAGVLTVAVPNTLAQGKYRICSISSSHSHQPVVMPVARRGPQDDCVRVNIVDNACPKIITVAAGDSLDIIARREGVSAAVIAGANNLFNPNQIFVGQKLQIVKPCTAQLNSDDPEAFTTYSEDGSSSGGVSTAVFAGVIVAVVVTVSLITFVAVRFYYLKKSGFTDMELSAPKV